MARIRTIKPEFWSDSRLATQLTRDQRLFYIGLWNEADDEGRFQAHPARLKGSIFPYDDDIHGGLIEDSLRALAGVGKVVLYDVEGEPYGQLVNFTKHQKINRPTPSRISPPPGHLPESASPHSLNPHGGLSEASVPEREGEGEREREKEEEREKEKDLGTAGAVAPLAEALGEFCRLVGVSFELKRESPEEWLARMAGEHPAVDIGQAITRATEWWDSALSTGKRKKCKAPSQALRAFFRESSNGNGNGRATHRKAESSQEPGRDHVGANRFTPWEDDGEG